MIYTKTLICNRSIWDYHNGAKKKKMVITINTDKNKFNVNDRKEGACYKGFKLVNKKTGAEAICNCGVDNFPAFAGSGCNREALLFLGKVLGLNLKKYLMVEFYG